MAIVNWQYKGTSTINPNGEYCLLCKDDKAYYTDSLFLYQSGGIWEVSYIIYILNISSNSWTTIWNQVQVDTAFNYLYYPKYVADGDFLYFFFTLYYPQGDTDYIVYCLKVPVSGGSPSLMTLLQTESQYYTFAVSKDYIYVCGGAPYITIHTFTKNGSLLGTQSTTLWAYEFGAQSNINNNYVIVNSMSNYIIYNYELSLYSPFSFGELYGMIIIDDKFFGSVYSSGTYTLTKYAMDFENGNLILEDTLSSFNTYYTLSPSTHCFVFYAFNYGTKQFKIGIANDSINYEETHYNLFNYGVAYACSFATFYNTIFIHGM